MCGSRPCVPSLPIHCALFALPVSPRVSRSCGHRDVVLSISVQLSHSALPRVRMHSSPEELCMRAIVGSDTLVS